MFKLSARTPISRDIAALSLVSLVVMMGSSMATPSLALYAGGFPGANEFLIGAVIAGFAVGRLIFDIPAGFVADRIGMSRTMILGLGILVGSSLLAAVAPSYWVLLSARILEGAGSAIYVSAAIAFVLLVSDPSRRGTAMGTYQSILMMGPIVGPVAGAPIAAYFGLNAPYFAFAAMMAGALLVVTFLGHRKTFTITPSAAGESLEETADSAGISMYVNTAGVATFGFAFLRSGIYSTGMPLFAYGGLSATVFDVGAILTAAALANLAASYFSGRITARYGMRRTLFAAIMLSAVFVSIIPFSSTVWQLLAIMMLIGVSSGFFGQSIAWAAEQIETRIKESVSAGPGLGRQPVPVNSHVTRGIGINRMIGDIGLILGPLFVGYLVSIFVKDPMVWIYSFGMTSFLLGAVSIFILRGARTSSSTLAAGAERL